MIPDTVKFSDIGEINPRETVLTRRVLDGPPPIDWTRTFVSRSDFIDIANLDKWCARNLNGRWARHDTCGYYNGGWTIVMWFESAVDAVFFKMSGEEPFELIAK